MTDPTAAPEKSIHPAEPAAPSVPPKPAGARRRALLWVLGLVSLGAVAYHVWNTWYAPWVGTAEVAAKGGPGKGGRGGPGAQGGPRAPVVVSPARLADVNILLTGLGTVTASNTVTVRTRVDGPLQRVLFREGQMVQQGDVLAEIDPRPFQAQVMQAEGQLARDQAQLRAAQVDLERYKTLLAQDSIAAQQIDTQQALVRQLEGTVKSDQGSLDNVRLQLSYTRVLAPIAGRVGLRQIDAGNIVHPGDAAGLVVITQLQPASVFFSVPEDNVPAIMRQLQTGKRLPVIAWDRDQKNRLAGGTLVTIDNQIDTTTGTVKLKALFPNNDLALFPNQFVNARLLLDVRRDALVVPSSAIQRGARGFLVYVVRDDQTVTAKQVVTGPVQGNDTTIESGLEVGDKVVVDGTDRLREGMRVETIVRPAPGARAPGQRRRGPGGAAAAAAPGANPAVAAPAAAVPGQAVGPREGRRGPRPDGAQGRGQGEGQAGAPGGRTPGGPGGRRGPPADGAAPAAPAADTTPAS